MLFSSTESLNHKNYDVVVIGSGLSGLTSANILGKLGHKVLLLEAHNKLGGLATWFFRSSKKYIFDVSLHGFPYGMYKTCKRYWSKEIADLIIPLKDIRFSNPQFKIKTDYTKTDFKKILEKKFNINTKTIEDFFSTLEKMNFFDKNQINNKDLFEKFFPGRNDVIRLLMEPITYANGSTLDDPALTYAIVFSNFMGNGVYTFKGGTDYLIKLMKDELIKNNVDIKLQSKVHKIITENGVVKGVLTGNDTINSKVVISNANLHHTIFNLVGEENFSKSFINLAKNVRMNSSSCQVYMSFKDNFTLPDLGDLIFTSRCPEYNPNDMLSLNTSSKTYSIYYPDTRPLTPMPPTIVASFNATYDQWKHLTQDQYEIQKNNLIKETLLDLDTLHPDLSKNVAFIEAATPLTIERYTHHYKGASFGTKYEGLEVSNTLHENIDGLYHSGSVGIIMSGWLGAANYGAIQANNADLKLYQIQKNNENKSELKENYERPYI